MGNATVTCKTIVILFIYTIEFTYDDFYDSCQNSVFI